MVERLVSLDDGQETCTKEKTASLIFFNHLCRRQKGAHS